MRVLIQGPGAVGRLLASRLASGGVDVTLVDHDRSRAEEITRDGIPVCDLDGNWTTVTVPAVVAEDLAAVDSTARWDLLISCVKSFDTDLAVRSGCRGLRDDGSVLVLSNGLGNLDGAEMCWSTTRCFAGAVVCGVLRDSGRGGHGVRVTGSGPISIGYRGDRDPARDERCDRIVEVLRRGGFDVDRSDDIDAVLWRKVAINCAVNPVAAMLEFENGTLLKTPAFGAAVAAAREVAEVARAHGIDLPAEGWESVVRDVCEATRENRCSMLEDLRSGRRTEIDALNGRVVELGEEKDVDVGVNRTLTRLIKALEERAALAGAPVLASEGR